MDTRDQILAAAYLFRASPEIVYEWLRAQHNPIESNKRMLLTDFWWKDQIPKEIEYQLLERKNEIIDLGLAAWGTEQATLSVLYERWCSRSAVPEWPPQPSTFSYAVLAAILSNYHAAGTLFAAKYDHVGLSAEDFDWLIEHADDNLLFLMHSNLGPAIGLLKQCAAKSGAYGRIDDERWLGIMGILGRNKRLHIPYKESPEDPDTDHWDIHEAFVHAATVSPKTPSAVVWFSRIFFEMPTAATNGTYIEDKKLNAAISAWDVAIPEGEGIPQWLSKTDALNPAERVQFHLLRHYCSYLDLDPDDPVRVRRLAAYAKSPLDGEKGWNLGRAAGTHKPDGKGLDIESLHTYSERDGPAFMFAISYNGNVWRDKNASDALENGRYPLPEDRDFYYANREKITDEIAAEQLQHVKDSQAEAVPIESQTHSAIEQLRKELAQIDVRLKTQVGNLKKWVIWGGIIIGVLLLLRH